MFKVLIAEDEPLIRKGIIYCTDWARLNCGIPLEASNGEEAAEMIRQHRPDIVLLDVNMPLMDGLDALFQTRGCTSSCPSWSRATPTSTTPSAPCTAACSGIFSSRWWPPSWRRPSALPSRSWSTTA